MAPSAKPTAAAPRLSNTWKVVISATLLFHLFALVVGPWSQPPPAPVISLELAGAVRPYLDAMYLNHGYRFFAPNPGPSHLVRYTLTYDDGRTEKKDFPSLKDQFPRLLYHRYFMLSEHLAQLVPPPNLPPELKKRADAEVQAVARGFANELMRRTGAKEVRLQLVEHGIPDPSEVLQGKPLTAPDLYNELELGVYQREAPRS